MLHCVIGDVLFSVYIAIYLNVFKHEKDVKTDCIDICKFRADKYLIYL